MSRFDLCVDDVYSPNLSKLIVTIRKAKSHELLSFLRSSKGQDFLLEATKRDDTALWLTVLGKMVEGASKRLSTPEYLMIVQTMLCASFETGNTQGLKVMVYNSHKGMASLLGLCGLEVLEDFLKKKKKEEATSDPGLPERLAVVLTDASMRGVFEGYSSRISNMMESLMKYDMDMFYDVYHRMKSINPRFFQNHFVTVDAFSCASQQGNLWEFYEFVQKEETDKSLQGGKHSLTRLITQEASKRYPKPYARVAIDEFFDKAEVRLMLDVVRQSVQNPQPNQIYTEGPLVRYDNLFGWLKKRQIGEFPLIMNFLRQHNSYGYYNDTLMFCENHLLRHEVRDKLEKDVSSPPPKRKM